MIEQADTRVRSLTVQLREYHQTHIGKDEKPAGYHSGRNINALVTWIGGKVPLYESHKLIIRELIERLTLNQNTSSIYASLHGS